VKQARDQWRADAEEIDPRRFRFIDESGAAFNQVAASDLLGWFTHCGYTTCFL
jgi:hypothetical protein